MKVFDVFKGRKRRSGDIIKIRSVGCGYYNRATNTYELQINGFAPNSHILRPEKDIGANNDYVIYHKSPYARGLQQVGVGHLMSGDNAGLVQLEWDIYGNTHIYLNLSRGKTERRTA